MPRMILQTASGLPSATKRVADCHLQAVDLYHPRPRLLSFRRTLGADSF